METRPIKPVATGKRSLVEQLRKLSMAWKVSIAMFIGAGVLVYLAVTRSSEYVIIDHRNHIDTATDTSQHLLPPSHSPPGPCCRSDGKFIGPDGKILKITKVNGADTEADLECDPKMTPCQPGL